jgi:hypothetical protein
MIMRNKRLLLGFIAAVAMMGTAKTISVSGAAAALKVCFS